MKNIQIKEFIGEIDVMREKILEIGDQKEIELKFLSSALQELAHRNYELEKELAARGDSVPTISQNTN